MAFRDLTTRSKRWVLAAAITLGVAGTTSGAALAAPFAPAAGLTEPGEPGLVPVQYGWGGHHHRHHHHHRHDGWGHRGGGHHDHGWGGHRGHGGGHHRGDGHHRHGGHRGYDGGY